MQLLALLVSSAAATTSYGPCPAQEKPCVLTLAGAAAPSASAECSSAAWSGPLHFTLPEKFADSDGNGSFETVLEVRLDPVRDCGCARLKVFYDDQPSGFTVHLGNSPTNDGHGGDQGTTPDAAELQVLDRRLTVYTASRRQQVDKLFDAPLPPLARGVLDLEVCDQTLGVRLVTARRGSPPWEWKLGTLSSKLLLSFDSAGDAQEPRALYVGLNRVIHRLNGAPARARRGTGVRRVEISVSP